MSFTNNLTKPGYPHPHPSLGVIRLDYDYPASKGDVDFPETFNYNVIYRVVPGLTFAMVQSGKMTDDVEQEFIKAIKWLEQKGVSVITGDCGFFMWFQPLARHHTKIPIAMSSLCQLPSISHVFCKHHEIIILTANGKSLESEGMEDLLLEETGYSKNDDRFVVYIFFKLKFLKRKLNKK